MTGVRWTSIECGSHMIPVHMQARDSLLLALRAMKNGLPERKKDIGLINRQDLAHTGPLLSVLESPTLFSMMEQLMVSTPS